MKEDFLKFIQKATSPFCMVSVCKDYLKGYGFEELKPESEWMLERGRGYFIDLYGSSIVAFYVGNDYDGEGRLCVAAAHSDQPCFVVKPNPVIKSGSYVKLNVETYGGAILSSWLDRPLGLSGIVVSKGKDVFHPDVTVVDFNRPLLVIPNLAIHFNRDVNKGVELNRQKDMLPLINVIEKEVSDNLNADNYLLKLLEKETKIASDDILDYQLYLYNCEPGVNVGADGEIIMAPRIDNLASAFACISALTGITNEHNINFVSIFDNEEVGSKTKQGAGSDALYRIIERVFGLLGISEKLNQKIYDGLFLSMDGAHAIHPNHPEKYDPTNPVYLNDGIVIKRAASQSYATDAVGAGIIKNICEKNDIKYKEFVNKSDSPGGSTLGCIASVNLPMRTVDVGVPMLAMHSAMETMGADDLNSLVKLTLCVFNE